MNNKEEKIKELEKQIRITKSDIEICKQYHDYEDYGFYTSRLSELEEELKELKGEEENGTTK